MNRAKAPSCHFSRNPGLGGIAKSEFHITLATAEKHAISATSWDHAHN